jgi:5-methyltetrahydrofolate--homocysteine methyltransferase
LIAEEKYDDAADIVRDMAEGKKAIVDVCVDSVPSDAKAAMTCFLNFALQYPDLARLPFMISSSRWDVIEAGLKCLQGKGLASLKEGETEYSRQEKLIRAYGAMPAVKKSDGLVVLD